MNTMRGQQSAKEKTNRICDVPNFLGKRHRRDDTWPFRWSKAFLFFFFGSNRLFCFWLLCIYPGPVEPFESPSSGAPSFPRNGFFTSLCCRTFRESPTCLADLFKGPERSALALLTWAWAGCWGYPPYKGGCLLFRSAFVSEARFRRGFFFGTASLFVLGLESLTGLPKKKRRWVYWRLKFH